MEGGAAGGGPCRDDAEFLPSFLFIPWSSPSALSKVSKLAGGSSILPGRLRQ